MNCGKNVFSRVARVCKNDQGGTRDQFILVKYSKKYIVLRVVFYGRIAFFLFINVAAICPRYTARVISVFKT